MILSSIGIVLAYWTLKMQEGIVFYIAGIISIIVIVISVVLCAVIGFALKKGKANVEKIIRLVEA